MSICDLPGMLREGTSHIFSKLSRTTSLKNIEAKLDYKDENVTTETSKSLKILRGQKHYNAEHRR